MAAPAMSPVAAPEPVRAAVRQPSAWPARQPAGLAGQAGTAPLALVAGTAGQQAAASLPGVSPLSRLAQPQRGSAAAPAARGIGVHNLFARLVGRDAS
ncbi:hypothetical protein [Melaminivora sp.]